MSLLSIETLDRERMERLFARTDEIASAQTRNSNTLSGLIIAMLFFQASTRTRLSFESAALRLGAQCIGFAEPGSARAGPGWKESVADTARMLNSYANASVIRHYERGAAAEYARHSMVPVVNAGDGCGMGAEHPTQAILDLYTIRHAFGEIDNRKVLLVGDLRQRTPHSLLKSLAKFSNVQVFLLQAEGYELSLTEFSQLRDRGLSVEVIEDYAAVIGDVDAIYLAGMEDPLEPSPPEHVLNEDVIARMRRDTIIMHPLPRGNELPSAIDQHVQAAYFRQASFGVPTRMAILESLFQ